MKRISKIFLLVIIVNLFSCQTSRVEDFFVPELPIQEEYFNINQSEGYGEELEFNFTLFKTTYNLTFEIEKSIYEEVNQKSKNTQYNSGMGMRQDQYDTFVYDDYDVDILNTIINAISESEGRKSYDLAQLIVAFVQSIPYDHNANDPKFTIETLFNKTGDCDDKSILLAKLLSYAGYDTCLFIYEIGQHMAVGLKVDESTDSYKDGYIFIESTGYNPIGNIPEKFADNVDIRNEDPKIIEVDIADSFHAISGYDELENFYSIVKNKYGDYYFNTTVEGRIILEDVKEIKKDMAQLESDIKSKRNNLDRTSESEINEFNKLVGQYNDNVALLNVKYNRLNEINSKNYIK